MSGKPFFKKSLKSLLKLDKEVVEGALLISNCDSLKIINFQSFTGILQQTKTRKKKEIPIFVVLVEKKKSPWIVEMYQSLGKMVSSVRVLI